MSNIKKTCLLKAHVSGRLFFDMFFYHTEQVLVYNKVNILLPPAGILPRWQNPEEAL